MFKFFLFNFVPFFPKVEICIPLAVFLLQNWCSLNCVFNTVVLMKIKFLSRLMCYLYSVFGQHFLA